MIDKFREIAKNYESHRTEMSVRNTKQNLLNMNNWIEPTIEAITVSMECTSYASTLVTE